MRLRRRRPDHPPPPAPAPTRPAAASPRGRFAAALGGFALTAALGPDEVGNVDRLRHPDGPPAGLPAPEAGAALAGLAAQVELDWLYEALEDDASRELMVRLFAFRLLGAAKVRLPLGVGADPDAVARTVAGLVRERDSVDLKFLGWHGDRFDLGALGYAIVLDAHPLNVASLVLEQYRSPQPPHVGVREGDVVIDGGGCWGDTALYFAALAGPAGRVRTFEFEPDNLELLRSNLRLNPVLAGRIDVDERALWHSSGDRLGGTRNGPATTLQVEGELHVASAAIDDLVAQGRPERVNFIKLDVEGAELSALRGARATLVRDRPRLAVSLYHRPEDWTTIPRFLHDLGVGYRFSLGHFTVHAEETVLFAWSDDEGQAGPPGDA